MSVHTSKNAELFLKALEDVWVAEQTWHGSPNNAVWHCHQAVEITMKGFLRCIGEEYDYGHDLNELAEVIRPHYMLSEDNDKNILFIEHYNVRLRYKNMPNDPSAEDARIAISRTKQILREYNDNPKIARFMDEAKEVHLKILKANYEKHSELDLSEGKPKD